MEKQAVLGDCDRIDERPLLPPCPADAALRSELPRPHDFNVLIESIKREFQLSDTAIGLLAGFGFVLFYSALGMPVARFADRANRRNIVAIAFAFWSAMTALCGMAQSVTVLALARIGVGIGESAGTPASQSIVADHFNKDERPRALGIFAIGTFVGVFLGYFVGGWVK